MAFPALRRPHPVMCFVVAAIILVGTIVAIAMGAPLPFIIGMCVVTAFNAGLGVVVSRRE